MNDPTTYNGPALVNPFGQREIPSHLSAGTVTIEEARAIAEVKGKLSVAKMFPRNEALAFQMAMDSCKRPSLAASANWKYKRGGQNLSGPSIRLAEELARCWGNLDYGIRELSRKDGVSEMQAYCWDMQTNTISSQNFTVRHLRDKTDGAEALTSERDIYEVTANMGARRLRARILAILPPDLVESAVTQCRKTIAGENSGVPIADRVKAVVAAFSQLGVTVPMLETYLGHPLADTLPDEFADLTEVRTAIKDGAPASEFFGSGSAALPAPGGDGGQQQQNAQQATQRATRKKDVPKDGGEPASQHTATTETQQQDGAAPALQAPAPATPSGTAAEQPGGTASALGNVF